MSFPGLDGTVDRTIKAEGSIIFDGDNWAHTFPSVYGTSASSMQYYGGYFAKVNQTYRVTIIGNSDYGGNAQLTIYYTKE